MSWFSNLFHHHSKPTGPATTDPNQVKVLNAQKIAGILGVIKAQIDGLAPLEHWTWVGQFDVAMDSVTNLFKNWKAGDSVQELTDALTAATTTINGIEAIPSNAKLIISTGISAAEAVLVLLAQ